MNTKFTAIFAGCLCAVGSLTFSTAHAQFRGASTGSVLSRGQGDSSVALTPLRGVGDNDGPLMPDGVVFDPNPTGTNSKVDPILVYGHDLQDHLPVPVKTLKITNLHTETIYPIFRDGNEAATKTNPAVGLYDPYDAVNREYRGYVGYKEGPNGPYRFGIKPNKSVLVRVPLVFWNGARMSILTEGKYLTPSGSMPNPLNYDSTAQKVIVDAEKDPDDGDLIKNGVVMWYSSTKSKPLAPSLDTPDQLVEWTIRDQGYLSSPQITARTFSEIPNSEKVNLINYDVSYVDNMFLPAAMEALNVPVPHPPYPPGAKPQPYGWIGSTNKVEGTVLSPGLQREIDGFTDSKDNKMLGTYFGGKGWPIYNIPMDYKKIPAGQNVFAQSPMADTRSNYLSDNNAYMLSTGGSLKDPVFVSIGSSGTAAAGTSTITLSANEQQSKIDFIKPGYKVKAGVAQDGTVVSSINTSSRQVVLSKPLSGPETGAVFDFFRTVDDYAATAMINIWYSWGKRYLANTGTYSQQTISGTIANLSATLKFTGSQSGLVEGMEVTGPGLRNPDPSKFQGGTIILSIASDGKSVALSNVSTQNVTTLQNYTFKKPQPLPSTPTSGLFDMTFTGKEHASRNPDEFAKKVYLAMASMAQIPKDPTKLATPHVIELMYNVVGGNMGQIFTNDAERFSDEGKITSAAIRDIIKSILRGVTDFTKYPEYDGKDRIWYPNPSEGAGNKTFNVYNLDPFVWFVHVALGFSGYGFSLDDDIADVGAGEATKMLLVVGGQPTGSEKPNSGKIDTPENANEWFIQAPYGSVTGMGDWDPDKTVTSFLAITNATNTSPIVVTSTNHNLVKGDKVTISEVVGNPAANKTYFIDNVTTNTFDLVGSHGDGNYVSGGKWTLGPMPYIAFQGADVDGVYWRIKGDDRTAGFQGAFVSGPAVEDPTTRVFKLENDQLGQVALNKQLTQTSRRGDVKPLPKGRYRFVFSGTVIKK